MRDIGRKKLFVIVALLAGLLIVPLVFSSGLVQVSELLSFSGVASSSAPLSTPTVFVDPAKNITDYEDLPISSTVTFDINVSDVTDLFAWQINMTWNASILNVNRIFAGEFLLRTPSENKTASYQLDFVINVTDNVNGYTGMGESILGDVSGESGNGALVSIEFLVTGYGSTNLTISLAGTLPTTLLSSTGGTLSFTKADGYFRNALLGDATLDGVVDVFDVLKVKYHRSGPPPGPGGYDRNVDINDDGTIDVFDILIVKANLGRSIP